MTATNAIGLMILGTTATIAMLADRALASDVQGLLDRGFEGIAEGQLVGAVECTPQSAPVTLKEIRQQTPQTCFTGKVTYGAFKRLKGDSGEFVCVSFQDWACYQSQNPN
jgi:hypothetical protein